MEHALFFTKISKNIAVNGFGDHAHHSQTIEYYSINFSILPILV